MGRKKREKISKVSVKKSLRVFRFIKPFRIAFIFGMLVLIISSIVTMAFPKVLGDLIDSVNSSEENAVNNITLILIGIFLVIAITSFLRIYLFGFVTQKSLALLRTETYKHLIASPMNFFSSKRVGELSSRITTDIALLEETFSTTIAEIIRQTITIPVALFFLMFISFRLTVFMIDLGGGFFVPEVYRSEYAFKQIHFCLRARTPLRNAPLFPRDQTIELHQPSE